jgi:hypothetical protein
MTTTLKEQQLADLKHEIHHIDYHIQCAYANGLSLRLLFEEKASIFRSNFRENSWLDIFTVPNCSAHMSGMANSMLGINIGTLKTILDLSENSTEFKEALALIQPKMDRVAEIELEIQAEREIAALAARALADAEEAARGAAEAALAKNPAVIAARAALEAAQPVLVTPSPDIILTRGKQRLQEPAQV